MNIGDQVQVIAPKSCFLGYKGIIIDTPNNAFGDCPTKFFPFEVDLEGWKNPVRFDEDELRVLVASLCKGL